MFMTKTGLNYMDTNNIHIIKAGFGHKHLSKYGYKQQTILASSITNMTWNLS